MLTDDNDESADLQTYGKQFGETGSVIKASSSDWNPFLQAATNVQGLLLMVTALCVLTPIMVLPSRDVVALVAATTVCKFIMCGVVRESIAKMKEQEIHLVIRSRSYSPNATTRQNGTIVLVLVYLGFLTALAYSYEVLLTRDITVGVEISSAMVEAFLFIAAFIFVRAHKNSYIVNDE